MKTCESCIVEDNPFMTFSPIQFGWVFPPGAKAKDIRALARHDLEKPSYLGVGPQANDARERFDAAMRRTLNAIVGHWDSAWITDHMQWGEDDCLEAMTELAFYSALFPALNWGTIVACQSYRNPAFMAKMASTIQYLTRGKLILGIGAGWKDDEYRAYGYDFPPPGVRVEQLEETVEIFKRMWTQEKSTFIGKHYRIENAINLPQTPKPPTLLVGGGGEKKMLPLVARYADWWNSNAQGDEWNRKVEILKRECKKNRRDFASLRLSWFGGATVGSPSELKHRSTRDTFMRDKGIWGSAQHVSDKIEKLIDAGCTYFMLDSRGVPDEGEIEQMIEITKKFAD
jgi:alkanesulfonate monooxygenase SsuD/methylene tetrahydromethanopterin reductase-like flavin-dependent oxidoreductase (luciferase family)